MPSTRIGIVGAAGETGSSIVEGLLEAGFNNIVALTRPASIEKPANLALASRGVEIRPLDTTGSHASIVTALKDIEILISAITASELLQQIPLANAAKEAGVKRFLPCAWGPIIPPGNLHALRDIKEQIFNHIKKLYLPYTIVDVGWWYQISFPRLPSGKIDYAVTIPHAEIAGSGDVPSALIDLRDIGRYVAHIVADERTLNKYVFVYNELWSEHDRFKMLEQISGEKIPRSYVSYVTLLERIQEAEGAIPGSEIDIKTPEAAKWAFMKVGSQYSISLGVRGDNRPESAKYLGYLDGKELYPEFKGKGYEDYLREVVEGKAEGVYPHLKGRFG